MSDFYGMPFFNYSDPDKFEVDNIHAFACACLSNSGILNRYGKDNCDFVWLDLQNINDSSVCSRFRTEIRSLLPSDMPSAEVLRYMPKSWRKGGCTRMAWERYLDYLNAIALSGHRGGSHMETYIDATGIGL